MVIAGGKLQSFAAPSYGIAVAGYVFHALMSRHSGRASSRETGIQQQGICPKSSTGTPQRQLTLSQSGA
jgi:hypothetical protein